MSSKNKTYNYTITEKAPPIVSEPTMIIGYSKTFDRINLLDNLAQSSMALFNILLEKSNLTIKFLAENIFEITPKTFIKYKNTNTVLPSRLAELAIELATLYDVGLDVFGNVNEFNSWLDANNSFLQNKKPSSFLNTSTGISLVRDAIKRIEYGATA